MRNLIVRSAIAYSLLVILIACAPSGADQPAAAPAFAVPTAAPAVKPLIPVKVGIYSFISYAPLYFSVQEGYFEQQGLDVELVPLGSAANADAILALVSGDLDAAGFTVSAGVLNADLAGSQIKYVADKGYLDPDGCPADAFVAGNKFLDSGLRADPTKIKGSTAVVPPGGMLEYSLDVMLARSGLTQADLNVTNIADSAARIEALGAGSVDVSILSEPWITRADNAGAAQVWMPFSSIIPNETMGAILYGPGILRDKPEVGTPFMVAYLRGVEQFNLGKTDRNVELIAEYTKLSPEDIRGSCWTSFRPDGRIDTQGLLAFQQWALDKGYIDTPLDLEAFWTSEFLDEAASQLGK